VSAAQVTVERLAVQAGGALLIQDLDLRAGAGTMLGVTGPSGSGKTTLLYTLAGLLPAAAGRVLLDGRPAMLWREASVALILQNLALVPVLSAQETVALPLQARGMRRGEIERRSAGALEALGLGARAAQLVAHLSGGQRQRVAVARALAGSHQVILADEPTSALDEHWRQVVLELLAAEARRGAVVIVASSDAAVISACQQVLRLG